MDFRKTVSSINYGRKNEPPARSILTENIHGYLGRSFGARKVFHAPRMGRSHYLIVFISDPDDNVIELMQIMAQSAIYRE